MCDNLSAQASKRFTLVARQRSAKISFVRDCELRQFCQGPFPFLSKDEVRMSTVPAATSAFNQASLCQLIDQ
jgi:hypothetical protein